MPSGEPREKRKNEEIKGEEDMEVDMALVEKLVDEWALEIQNVIGDEPDEDCEMLGAWDDVNGGALRAQAVKLARREEVGYMQKKGIWRLVPVKECGDKTGKDPVSMRWVDTNKGDRIVGNLESVGGERFQGRR